MNVSRRQWMIGSGLTALTAACHTSRDAQSVGRPAGGLGENALESALQAAKREGASYADARVVRRRSERMTTRDDHVERLAYDENFGIGVRVIVAGAWGFAASAEVTPDAAADAARLAVAIAKANAKLVKRRIELAPTAVHRDRWVTPLQIDPFQVPLKDKAQLLLAVWPEAKKVAGVRFCEANYDALAEWKLFASTEGSLIEQSVTRLDAGYRITAVDPKTGEFAVRAFELPPRQAGWEHVTGAKLVEGARKTAEDCVEKLKAPAVTPGRKDLVLTPSHLWLTIHESVGHPTELDRVLGYEANFAGTSFATQDKLGKLSFAAPHLTLYADKTTPGGLATCGYDDEGVQTQKWDLVKDGVLVGYQTTRDQAAFLGEKASRGTCYGEDYKSFPFQRMPNVSLAPGAKEQGLQDLIAATEDGVLISGNGSWSIDHQRYNFQFGGQTFHEIKNGKITHALKDVAYQANTLEFWHSCDLLGGAASWELHGSLSDGKGEPSQSNAVSHGCPPARFRNVNVINTNARGRA